MLGVFRRPRSPGTTCLYLLLACLFIFYATVPCSPHVQAWYMQKFHPGRMPFLVWAPMQLVPSMYSFENRLEIKSSRGNSTVWTNHYPMHFLFFRFDRSVMKAGGPYDVELISQYRDVILKTRYRVLWSGNAFDVTRSVDGE